MSLINEALKKAQSERGISTDHRDRYPTGPVHHLQEPKRKRSRLFGYLMAVLIVGLFSASVSTFLVYKILGDEQPPVLDMAPAPAPAREAPVAAQPETPAKATEAAPSPEEPPTAEPVTAVMVTEAANPANGAALPPPPAPEPEPMPGDPDSPVWDRIQQLEVRGMMSGGTKVLIFDSGTGKTKSFVEGDVVDGRLSLKITSIQADVITFEDYGRKQYQKSF